MNEDIKITCTNDVYKYSPDQIYDYIYKLQNNWNELKSWLEECFYDYEAVDVYDLKHKMQKLENSNNE